MDNKYFASLPAQETAEIIVGKIDSWKSSLETNGYTRKICQSWAQYHGARYGDNNDGHQITFSGEQGELVNISVNHFRNIAQNMLVMTTANRPSMDARAINTDYQSLVQAQLANGLLDYYLREKRLESYLKIAVEYAISIGSGYIKVGWNPTSGQIYDHNEETDTPIYEGDIEYSNLSPFDVIFDASKENSDFDWIICRSFKNKYDLAAKYPDLEEPILNVNPKDKTDTKMIRGFGYNDTDDIPIYEFYHKRTESMPNGRYMLVISSEAIPIDSPMPYRRLPVFRISPSMILGTPFGYTPLFDLLPIQEAIDSLYSTILTNQNAFGVQNLWVPKGSDVSINSLGGGLNIIEGNGQFGKPEPLNLTNTPPEIFNFLQTLERSIETISGVNSVTRGNPEASLKSGTALALVQSMTLQFMSGLQQEYVKLIEDVGTALIEILQDFAKVPRIATIAGKQNRPYMKEFIGDDLLGVKRVVVDVGNPLASTTAGRVQMAEQMMQMGVIKSPQDYLAVINTGNLDLMTEDNTSEFYLIKGENENLARGEQVMAIAIDDHTLHIKEHRSVLSNPDLRTDAALVENVLNHIQEHIELLKNVDPNLLAILGQQSLAPQQGAPPQGAPPDMSMGLPPEMMQGMLGQNLQPNMGGGNPAQEIIGPGLAEGANVPGLPSPPAPFENNPVLASQVPLNK